MDNVNFIMVVSIIIPFVVSAIKLVLGRFNIKIRSQVIVGIVCAAIALVYAFVIKYAPQDILSTIAEVGGVTFLMSQSLYKFYEDKGNNSKNT